MLGELEDLPEYVMGVCYLNKTKYIDDTVLKADTERRLQETDRKYEENARRKDCASVVK